MRPGAARRPRTGPIGEVRAEEDLTDEDRAVVRLVAGHHELLADRGHQLPQPAEERAGDPQAAKTEAYAAQTAGPARKRVQVLFILVDPSASSESPPVPAGQRN